MFSLGLLLVLLVLCLQPCSVLCHTHACPHASLQLRHNQFLACPCPLPNTLPGLPDIAWPDLTAAPPPPSLLCLPACLQLCFGRSLCHHFADDPSTAPATEGLYSTLAVLQ